MANWFLTKICGQFKVEWIVFSTNVSQTNEHSYAKQINFNLYLLPYTKINPKYLTHLDEKCKTIKLLEENRQNLCNLGLRGKFLATSSKHGT